MAIRRITAAARGARVRPNDTARQGFTGANDNPHLSQAAAMEARMTPKTSTTKLDRVATAPILAAMRANQRGNPRKGEV
jgi:hypothetical protein